MKWLLVLIVLSGQGSELKDIVKVGEYGDEGACIAAGNQLRVVTEAVANVTIKTSCTASHSGPETGSTGGEG